MKKVMKKVIKKAKLSSSSMLSSRLIVPAALTAFVGLAASVSAAAVDAASDAKLHTKKALEANPAAEWDPEVIFVRFRSGANANVIDQVRAVVGGETVETYWLVPGLETMKVKGDVFDAIDVLAMFPSVVEYAEPDYIVRHCVTPNDPSFGQLWGLNNTGQTVNGDGGSAGADINGLQAWDTFTGDQNFIIADIDTGVNYNHPDLVANMWTNPGEIPANGIDDDGNGRIDDVHGWDFYNNDSDPIDDNGHGTHTSGTFGARGDNGIGVTGVNWRCRIMAMKFLGAGGSGSSSGALSCLQYALEKGVRVSNNSWGGGPSSSSLQTAITNSQSMNHIFVAAAGNFGSNNNSSPFYPSSYNSPNIIAVASTTNNDTLSGFSNYGATSVDVGAPGSTIYSTYGSSYAYLDGTSMATPHVTGVVALVTAANPSWTWTQVRDQVLNTARPISALNGRCVTGAVLNAQAAVLPPAPPVPPDAPAILTSEENGYGLARITWADNSANELGFDVHREKLKGENWVDGLTYHVGSNATSYQMACTPGVWRFQVRATNNAGSSAYTTTMIVRPQQATGIRAINIVGTAVTLSWIDTSAFDQGFRVERETLVNSVWTSAVSFTSQSATTQNVVPDYGVYRYRVQSFAGTQNSVFSPWSTVYVDEE